MGTPREAEEAPQAPPKGLQKDEAADLAKEVKESRVAEGQAGPRAVEGSGEYRQTRGGLGAKPSPAWGLPGAGAVVEAAVFCVSPQGMCSVQPGFSPQAETRTGGSVLWRAFSFQVHSVSGLSGVLLSLELCCKPL